jgi:hypothetical protein
MRTVRHFAALLAALLLALPAASRAKERILSFVSDVTVKKDGALDVVETIRVMAEGDRIQRGIFRDFPIRYRGQDGGRTRTGFDVVSVERDGAPENWIEEPRDDFVRVRMGRADVPLPAGEHVYVLRYRTTHQLGHFPTYDELYWNATGTGWPFAIDVAEAQVRLPAGTRSGKRAAYTGPLGSTAADAEVVSEGHGRIVIRTTRPLGIGEGLTIAVAWPKGIVAAPAHSSAED